MLKLHTFIHLSASLPCAVREKEGAFLVTVAPSQLRNTVTHTMGWRCPQNDSSQLCSVRRRSQTALLGRGLPQFPASPLPPPPSQRAPGNPKEQLCKKEGTRGVGKGKAREREGPSRTQRSPDHPRRTSPKPRAGDGQRRPRRPTPLLLPPPAGTAANSGPAPASPPAPPHLKAGPSLGALPWADADAELLPLPFLLKSFWSRVGAMMLPPLLRLRRAAGWHSGAGGSARCRARWPRRRGHRGGGGGAAAQACGSAGRCS